MKSLNVHFRSEMSSAQSSASPSSQKPPFVVADWLSDPRLDVKLFDFEPCSIEDLALAHDREWVSRVLSLKEPNGFGGRQADVAASLPYTVGSLASAALMALEGADFHCAPASGFHHAEYSKAMGFCTFNGLMVAAAKARQAAPGLKVGILDCDAHYGNGTDDIIAKLGIGWIEHRTMGASMSWASDCAGGRFEAWLERSCEELSDCGLILYQAGADPHVDDPFGGMLSSEQMLWRDKEVFRFFEGTPLAWCLAGGYQCDMALDFPDRIRPVLDLHKATALACCALV